MNTVVRPSDTFTAEFVNMGESDWTGLLKTFADATFYQSRSYAEVRCGDKRISQMVLRRNGQIAALAQIRLHMVPLLPYGLAYVQLGPLWRKRGEPAEPGVFQQAIAALTREFVHQRRLTLLIKPALYDAEPESRIAYEILEDSGFSASRSRDRTLILDIRPSLQELRKGLRANWRRHLNKGEKAGLQFVMGTTEDLLHTFAEIYTEMRIRKGLKHDYGFSDLAQAFSRMPENARPLVFLALHNNRGVAGIVTSTVGTCAIGLFSAVNREGMQLCASNSLEWNNIMAMKAMGIEYYDLAGIDPDANPGTYNFKAGLCMTHGVDTYRCGFVCSASRFNDAIVRIGTRVRSAVRRDQYIQDL